MPLSEHEQQVLDELERTLLADDPKFANTLRAGHRAPIGVYVLGGIGMLVGLGVLILGVAIEQVFVGVLGFGIMFGAAVLAMTKAAQARAASELDFDSPTLAANTAERPARVKTGSRDSFMSRVEDRWDRRTDGQ